MVPPGPMRGVVRRGPDISLAKWRLFGTAASFGRSYRLGRAAARGGHLAPRPGAPMIHIALASNSAYFDGLAVSVLSVLRSNAGEDLGFHILDGGLTPAEKRFLSRRVRAHGHRNEVRFYPLDASVFEGLRRDYGNSYMTYARILIGSLLDIGKVIYLDTDLLV